MIEGKKVTIFGGSGFIGKSVVQKLAKAGAVIRVAVRDPQRALFLKTMGDVGQITPLAVRLYDFKNVQGVLRGSDIAINLIGVLYEKGAGTFEAIHHQGARMIAKACTKEKVARLVHISALGANPASDSRYASSKGRGEIVVRKEFPAATLLRPSVVFGPDDAFFNRFAEFVALSPFVPVFGGGKTRFQPVYVEDVAEAIIQALEKPESQGKIYELGGAKVYTFRELMELILHDTQRHRIILSFPYFLGKIIGVLMQWLPKPPLTLDQVRLLQKDTVVSPEALTLSDLGVTPTALEEIVPYYLKRFCPHF